MLSITYTTIFMRKPKYLNKLINEELTRNTRTLYYILFSIMKVHLIILCKRLFGCVSPTLWNSLIKTLCRILCIILRILRIMPHFIIMPYILNSRRSYDFCVEHVINLYIFCYIFSSLVRFKI